MRQPRRRRPSEGSARAAASTDAHAFGVRTERSSSEGVRRRRGVRRARRTRVGAQGMGGVLTTLGWRPAGTGTAEPSATRRNRLPDAAGGRGRSDCLRRCHVSGAAPGPTAGLHLGDAEPWSGSRRRQRMAAALVLEGEGRGGVSRAPAEFHSLFGPGAVSSAGPGGPGGSASPAGFRASSCHRTRRNPEMLREHLPPRGSGSRAQPA